MKRGKIKGSSNVAEIGYNSNNLTLQVKFLSGGIYDYSPVTQEGYDQLMKAESKGKFLNKHFIYNKSVTCEKVG